MAVVQRVWLAENKEGPGTDDLFLGGLLTTAQTAPMDFETEEKLLERLKRRNSLLGQVFFNGMPLEQYQKIWCCIRDIDELQQNPSGRRRQSPEQIRRACDDIWENVKFHYCQAIRAGLCIEERSQEE